MHIWTQFRASVLENLVVWILLVMLAIALYGNYQRGKKLDRVCELLGAHSASSVQPQGTREEIDTICLGREPEE